MTNFYSNSAKVLVSVDCIVLGFEEKKLRLLAGHRRVNPGFGEWSLYGGFVGENESVDDAAKRVLYELTGLSNLYMKQIGTFGEVDRDPGERVISVAYCALINVNDYDEAWLDLHNLEWVDLENLPKMFSDHNKMVMKTITMLRKNISTEPLTFNLLPELFTLTQLQKVYEAILGKETDKRNFRKKIKQMEYIRKTDKIDKVNSKRGAALFYLDREILENETFKL